MTALALLERTAERFLRDLGLRPGERLLLAFSGGPDSSALALGLLPAAQTLGVRLEGAHLDHGLDRDSGRRSAAARRLAAELGLPLTVDTLDAARIRAHPDGLEAGARAARYQCLGRLADRLGARFVATAHHGDDQSETVALRLLYGSGLRGLAAIRPRHGCFVRPFLPLRREQLRQALAAAGVTPIEDPTNRDLSRARNRVRHRLLPWLCRADPRLPARLRRLATAAGTAADAVDRALGTCLAPRGEGFYGAVAIDRLALAALPPPLRPHALALLHRRAAVPYPPSAAARRELGRQLRAGGRVGCDCGRGWRWEGDSRHLRLVPRLPPAGEFTYTLQAPGEVTISELGLVVRLSRGPSASWMHEPDAQRAGLVVPPPFRLTVRNRRPGDRIRLPGAPGHRRLKDLLIDRKLPRHQRDRTPLLCVDDSIAWVPGVTVAEPFRVASQTRVWIAEIVTESLLPFGRSVRIDGRGYPPAGVRQPPGPTDDASNEGADH